MSETVEQSGSQGGETASIEDVQRTLRELQRKSEDLERNLESERRQRASLENVLETERFGRVTAEQDRDTQAARVLTEAELRWNAEKEAAAAAAAAKQKEIDQAEEAYYRYAEGGDWKEAAKAQRVMAEAAAEAQAERQRLRWLETNREKLVPKTPPQQPQRQAEPAATHRYQRFVSGPLVGGEEEWLDRRPQFQTDASYREQVFAATNLAAKKYARGSDNYLREIERLLDEEPAQDSRRSRNRRNEDDYDDDAPAPRRQSADLPPSRRAGPGERPSGSDLAAQLTDEEKEMADNMYGNPNNSLQYVPDRAKRQKLYADNKQIMLKMRAR